MVEWTIETNDTDEPRRKCSPFILIGEYRFPKTGLLEQYDSTVHGKVTTPKTYALLIW